MAKYRKKPVVVEAVQWHGFDQGPKIPGLIPYTNCRVDGGKGQMLTLEGVRVVSPRDWIITERWGNRSCCKADIFEATYEPVE